MQLRYSVCQQCCCCLLWFFSQSITSFGEYQSGVCCGASSVNLSGVVQVVSSSFNRVAASVWWFVWCKIFRTCWRSCFSFSRLFLVKLLFLPSPSACVLCCVCKSLVVPIKSPPHRSIVECLGAFVIPYKLLR